MNQQSISIVDIPEVIAGIASRLSRRELAACVHVNRQWNEEFAPFLYRVVDPHGWNAIVEESLALPSSAGWTGKRGQPGDSGSAQPTLDATATTMTRPQSPTNRSLGCQNLLERHGHHIRDVSIVRGAYLDQLHQYCHRLTRLRLTGLLSIANLDRWRQLVQVLRSLPLLQVLYLGVADRPPACVVATTTTTTTNTTFGGHEALSPEDGAILAGGFAAVARALPKVESVELTGFGGIQASEIVAFLDHCPRLLNLMVTIRPLTLDWPTTATVDRQVYESEEEGDDDDDDDDDGADEEETACGVDDTVAGRAFATSSRDGVEGGRDEQEEQKQQEADRRSLNTGTLRRLFNGDIPPAAAAYESPCRENAEPTCGGGTITRTNTTTERNAPLLRQGVHPDAVPKFGGEQVDNNARSRTDLHSTSGRRYQTQDMQPLQQQHIGGDAAVSATALASESSTSRTTSSAQKLYPSRQPQKQPRRPKTKARRMYRLQRLGLYTPMLEEVITPFLLALMPHCPDLQSLMVPQLERERNLFRFCDILRSTCHRIEWLSFLGFLEQPDRHMAAILRALPAHRLQDVMIPTMTVGDETLAALLDYQSLQLRRLTFLGSAEGKIPSRWTQQMLTRAAKLEVLIASRFTNMLTQVIVLDVEDALLSDWQCLQLEQLDIAVRGICYRNAGSFGSGYESIRDWQQGVQPNDEADEGEPILPRAVGEKEAVECTHHERCLALQRHVYWQLGRLQHLQQLTLVSDPAGDDGLQLQLGKGLEQLQGLRDLVWLYVGGNWTTLGSQEAIWIGQKWPRFRAIVAQVDQRSQQVREVEALFREHCPQVNIQVST